MQKSDYLYLGCKVICKKNNSIAYIYSSCWLGILWLIIQCLPSLKRV